jgi:hypothetical protein
MRVPQFVTSTPYSAPGERVQQRLTALRGVFISTARTALRRVPAMPIRINHWEENGEGWGSAEEMAEREGFEPSVPL